MSACLDFWRIVKNSFAFLTVSKAEQSDAFIFPFGETSANFSHVLLIEFPPIFDATGCRRRQHLENCIWYWTFGSQNRRCRSGMMDCWIARFKTKRRGMSVRTNRKKNNFLFAMEWSLGITVRRSTIWGEPWPHGRKKLQSNTISKGYRMALLLCLTCTLCNLY